MTFDEWMISKGLSASTADKYVGAISGPLTEWAQLHQITFDPLDEVNDADVFASLAEKIVMTPEFEIRNKRGNHMYSAALHKYAAFLVATESMAINEKSLAEEISEIENEHERTSLFDPKDQEDARKKVLRQIVVRQGQPKFRASLIEAYGAKCAITQCAVLPILEAAHITPYLGIATNMIENGILLRSDIHTLWDLHLIAIDPVSKLVFVNSLITENTYRVLHGTTAAEPIKKACRPSAFALQKQWELLQKYR